MQVGTNLNTKSYNEYNPKGFKVALCVTANPRPTSSFAGVN